MITIHDDRSLEAIAMGRANVDLYTSETGVSLFEADHFERFVGGSPANIATSLARLGVRTGFIGKVSQDQFGAYVRHYLQQVGVDVTGIILDDHSGSRTSLAFAERRPQDCDVILYREGAADLALAPDEIAESYIGSASLLVISGTALSGTPSREAVLLALEYAERCATTVCFDLDYRSPAWRSPLDTGIYYRAAAAKSSIIIGTREEYDALEFGLGYEPLGTPEEADRRSAEMLLHAGDAKTRLVVIKHGEAGSTAFTADGAELHEGVFPVTVKKPYGAGDAFAGGLLYALLRGAGVADALHTAAAAASIVISGDACSESSPTAGELESFMSRTVRGRSCDTSGEVRRKGEMQDA